MDKAGQQAASATRNTHFCQPLIDGVANHACNSSFFHTVRCVLCGVEILFSYEISSNDGHNLLISSFNMVDIFD